MNFISTIFTLFLVQDPIGNIPVFLSLLQNVPPQRRAWVIIRENLIAFLILTLFLFGGQSILRSLHLTEHALGIVGGIILFVVAFKMLFPSELTTSSAAITHEEPLLVPLATPLLAGPSTIATITLLASQYPHHSLSCFLSLVIVSLISTIILLLALPLYKWLGPKLLQAFERLIGILLITLATQMTLDSLLAYTNMHIAKFIHS